MRPLIVASLPVRKIEDLYLIEKFLDSDFIELRLDYLKDPTLVVHYYDYLEKYRNKLVLTLRDKNEGGIFEIDPILKQKLIKEFYDKGFLYDIEIKFIKEYKVPYDNKILSAHYFTYLPSKTELLEIINNFIDSAYTIKIALPNLKGYKELLASLVEYDKITLVPMVDDPAERIAFGLLGSKLIYSYATEKLAPGQLYYKKVREIFNYIEMMTSSSVT